MSQGRRKYSRSVVCGRCFRVYLTLLFVFRAVRFIRERLNLASNLTCTSRYLSSLPYISIFCSRWKGYSVTCIHVHQGSRLMQNMAISATAGLLCRQLKLIQSDKDNPGISCGLVDNNVLQWEVMLMISDDCRYYGGMRIGVVIVKMQES
jgi:hypothetical protein